jgi:hypothetical protein
MHSQRATKASWQGLADALKLWLEIDSTAASGQIACWTDL